MVATKVILYNEPCHLSAVVGIIAVAQWISCTKHLVILMHTPIWGVAKVWNTQVVATKVILYMPACLL